MHLTIPRTPSHRTIALRTSQRARPAPRGSARHSPPICR